MVNLRFGMLVIASSLSGCANLDSIYRSLDVGANAHSVAVDVKQRAIYSYPRVVEGPDKKLITTQVVCAEPSPDALSAYSASGGLTALLQGAAGGTANQAQAAFAFGEAAGSIGLRTQSIQLLRDGLFSNCLAYLNGAVDNAQFYELQRRSQNFTLGLLAIEQLTGVVKADQVALSTSSSAATGSDNVDKETTALAAAQKNQNDAKTSLAQAQSALKDATSALSDQQGKVTEARKKQAALKDPDEAAKKAAEEEVKTAVAALAPLQKDVESKRIAVDSAVRGVANADSQVGAAQEGLTMAQMRVRAAASGTAQLLASGGTRAAVTDKVATAVTSIVNAVLSSSGDEACWSMYFALVESTPARLENNPQLASFTSRCGQTQQTALAREIATKAQRNSETVPNSLRRALPQINQFSPQ